MVTVISSQSQQDTTLTAEDVAEIRRLANEINLLQQKMGGSATTQLTGVEHTDAASTKIPRSTSRSAKKISLKKPRSFKKSRSSKKEGATYETKADESTQRSPAEEEIRDVEEVSKAPPGPAPGSIAAISQREDMSLGQKLDLLIFGVDTTKSAADVHISTTDAAKSPPVAALPEVSPSPAPTSTANTKKATSTNKKTARKMFLVKKKLGRGGNKTPKATMAGATSTNAAPTMNAGLCFCDAVNTVGKSIEEATNAASNVKTEVNRMIYDCSTYLDCSNDAAGIPQGDDLQQLYSAFTKSFTKEEADESAEKEVVSQMLDELNDLEEDAKWADEERQLREAEFEKAAKVRIINILVLYLFEMLYFIPFCLLTEIIITIFIYVQVLEEEAERRELVQQKEELEEKRETLQFLAKEAVVAAEEAAEANRELERKKKDILKTLAEDAASVASDLSAEMQRKKNILKIIASRAAEKVKADRLELCDTLQNRLETERVAAEKDEISEEVAFEVKLKDEPKEDLTEVSQ